MKTSFGAGTLAVPTPVWVIGTYDAAGKPNVMTAAWGCISCSRPPCVSVSLRSATYSHAAIMARRAFTVSIPAQSHAREADYIGMVSGRDTDKFAATGLTPVGSSLVDAPYVNEFPLILECRVVEVTELGLHTQFTGEIVDVKGDDAVKGANGSPDMGAVKPLLFDPGSRKYYGVGTVIGDAFSMGKKK